MSELVLRWLGWVRKSKGGAGERGKGDDEPVPWVPVAALYDLVKATLITARLEDQGIPARMRQESASRAFPVSVGILGRIDILVPEPMVERAKAILEDLADSQAVDEPNEGSGSSDGF